MHEALFERLEDAGAEVNDTLDRLMGDEDFYVEYLLKLKENENIHLLAKAVEAKNFQEAEKEVHTLKGVALNLGLLPLVDVCMDMLLDLRAGKTDQISEQMVAINDNFNEWMNILKDYQ